MVEEVFEICYLFPIIPLFDSTCAVTELALCSRLQSFLLVFYFQLVLASIVVQDFEKQNCVCTVKKFGRQKGYCTFLKTSVRRTS